MPGADDDIDGETELTPISAAAADWRLSGSAIAIDGRTAWPMCPAPEYEYPAAAELSIYDKTRASDTRWRRLNFVVWLQTYVQSV